MKRACSSRAITGALLALVAGAVSGCSRDADAAAPKTPVAAAVAGASALHPVVLELFQSQGCSSCPPANANLNALADRPDVLALSFSVTYWDRLGWKDTFGSPAWTARQWDYARAGGRPQVATPQVIVNGRTAIVGSNRTQLEQTLAAAGPARGGPALTVTGDTLGVSAGKVEKPATVWLVRYDPRVQQVPIRAGENSGRTLPHRDIVRSMTAIGAWNGAAMTIPLPHPTEDQLAGAVLVQAGRGGPIVAAIKL